MGGSTRYENWSVIMVQGVLSADPHPHQFSELLGHWVDWVFNNTQVNQLECMCVSVL